MSTLTHSDSFDENAEIHLNLDENEFSDIASLDKDGIREAAKQGFTRPTEKEGDLRPRATCSRTKLSYLVDSGAALSVFPIGALPPSADLKSDPTVALRAVNGTMIPTFGRRTFRLQFGKAHFTHTFTIAPISTGVLGWDFLSRFRLGWAWQGAKCKLVHGKKNIHLTMTPVTADIQSLQIATVSDDFKAYSAAAKVTESDPNDIPPSYQAILDQFPGIDTPDFRKKPAHGVTHVINTGDHPPCRAKVRHLLPGSPKEVLGKKTWLEMEKQGIIERIKRNEVTTWSTALHLAPKADGKIRACGDFRPLNAKTALDTHPLPNIRNFQDKLKGAKVFSTVDLKAAYYQVPISRESSFKTTTLTPWGNFRYLRMPMGIKNSGPSFQRMIESVLQGLEGLFIYLDDILIWGQNESEHQQRVKAMLQRLHENGLAISRDKCQFSKPAIQFLGYLVDQNGIVPLPRKVETITAFPPPQKTQITSWIFGGN